MFRNYAVSIESAEIYKWKDVFDWEIGSLGEAFQVNSSSHFIVSIALWSVFFSLTAKSSLFSELGFIVST